MGYRPTGKPPGRPRLDGLPAGSIKKGADMADKETKPEAVDYTQTPGFAEAVAKAAAAVATAALPDLVAKQMESMKAEMLASMDQSQPVDAKTSALLSKLAMEIGVISDQGTQRKRVAPEEMRERINAYERMGVLLTNAQSLPREQKPLYRVTGKQYMDNQVIDPYQRLNNREIIETTIIYDGVPNTSMKPLNELASQVYAEFIRYLGGSDSVNGVPKPAQPSWITNGGRVIIGSAPDTAAVHGLARTPEPITINGGMRVGAPAASVEIISPTDPRATKVPVLGTIAQPAVVGGTTAKLA